MEKKKKLLIALCVLWALVLIAVLVLNLAFCRIRVVSGRDLVDECPRWARPGREVTVTTAVVDDGELYVSGVDGRFVRPGVYVFTMPDGDVQLRLNVVACPDGA